MKRLKTLSAYDISLICFLLQVWWRAFWTPWPDSSSTRSPTTTSFAPCAAKASRKPATPTTADSSSATTPPPRPLRALPGDSMGEGHKSLEKGIVSLCCTRTDRRRHFLLVGWEWCPIRDPQVRFLCLASLSWPPFRHSTPVGRGGKKSADVPSIVVDDVEPQSRKPRGRVGSPAPQKPSKRFVFIFLM